MKVLLLHQNRFGRPWGGIENYCRQLSNLFLDDPNIDIQLSPLYPHSVKFGKLKYDPIDLKAAILNSEADIIHINGYTSFAVKQGIQIASQLGRKIILSPHWHPFNKMNSPLLARTFWNIFIKPYIHLVNGILCINNEDSAFFSKLHPFVSTIPHWIMDDSFIGDITYTPKNNNILFVGRSEDENKGFRHLLNLPENLYDIHCVAKPIYTGRKDITFHSQISKNELIKLYKEASLVVIPSRYEAFSYVALEAVCSGCPIVMTNGVRFSDYISDNSIIGKFEFGNYSDFQRMVKDYIGKRYNPENYTLRFKKEHIKEEYKLFYNNVMYGQKQDCRIY